MRLLLVALAVAIAAAVPARSILAQPSPKGIKLVDLAWPEAANVLRAETVVVIPIGAEAKEHGPHLKLSNDAILTDYLTQQVVNAADVVVAPRLSYHHYPAFIEYPGSTSLALETARALTTDVVLSLARFGPRRFYMLNSGISTSRALNPAAKALAAHGILLGYTDFGALADRASARVRKEEGGTHADEVETSMMLFIDPSSVDMRRAVKDYTPSTGPLHLTRTPGTPGATFSASGIWGDPTLATRDKGRTIVEGVVAGILEDIEAFRRMPVPTASAMPSPPAAAPPMPSSPTRGQTGPRGCTAGDERTIRSLGEAYSAYWANADAAQLAGLWSDEGDIVHPDGSSERGRDVIRANRAALFMRREYRGSLHPLTIGNVRCLSPDIAVADGKWELRGLTDAGGKTLPSFEGLCTLILKRVESWRIEAYRYTQKPAAAPMPTLLKRPGFIRTP